MRVNVNYVVTSVLIHLLSSYENISATVLQTNPLGAGLQTTAMALFLAKCQ